MQTLFLNICSSVAHADSVPFYGAPGTKFERTFIAIKPDGVHRALVGEVIKRFEAKGYKLVGMKLVHPTEAFAAKHYSDLSTKPFFGSLVKYFSSGPVIAMVWEGRNVIAGGRKLVGATNPDEAVRAKIVS
jgi:nucleoside-diphosphate kinase